MGVTAAQLVAQVTVQGATEAKSQLQGMSESVEKTSGGFKSMLGNALSFAAGQFAVNAVGQAFGFLKDQVSDTIQLTEQQQDAMAQTAAVIKSTGDVSGESAQAIANLADSLSQVTTYSEPTIESGENLLLTFTNIGKNVFPQATQAILDVSTGMGQDLKSSAVQVGKALDDPIQGITALTRIGVTFSDKQKEAIKQMMATGDTAGAQKIILQELEREFGNSAEAAGDTFGGKLQILQNKFDDLKVKIGTAVMPILTQFLGFISSNILPILSNFSDWFTNTGLPALQSFGNYLSGTVVPAFQNAGTWISKFTGDADAARPILIALGAVIATALVPVIWSFAAGVIAATWPVLLIGGAIAGLIAIFEHFYNTNSGFKTFIDGLVSGFKQVWGDIQANFIPTIQRLAAFFQANILPILQQVGGFLLSTFMPVWKQLQALWSGQILPLIQQLWGALQPALPVFKLLGEIIGGIVVVALGLLVGIITGVIKGFAGMLSGFVNVIGGIVQLFTGVIQVVSGIVRFLYDLFTGNFSKLGSDLGAIWQGIINIFGGAWNTIKGIFQEAWGAISGLVSGFVQGIIGFFQGLWDKLVGHSIIPDMINSIVSFFESLPGKCLAAIVNMVTWVTSHIDDFKNQAVSKFQDLVNGVLNLFNSLPQGIQNIWNTIVSDAKSGINFIIGIINGFIDGLNKLHVNLPGGGSLGFNIPDIPKLAAGGIATSSGMAIVGEAGPEAVWLPAGAQVIPHSQLAGAGQAQVIVNPPPIYLDGRQLAAGLMPYITDQIRWMTGARM